MTRPEVLALPGRPAPIGLYSHAVAVPTGARLVAISGQLAVDAAGEPLDGGFEVQMRAVVASLDAILDSLGTDLRSVVKFTTYLIDPDDVERFYAERALLWSRWWPEGDYPGNTLLVVQRLVRPEFRIEIEAIAAVPETLMTGANP
ncbi:MAG: hypothetical protein JWM47_1136 [Acidimicrobiales bacterium]|nr:hypothetical protein [Acidimicrobiales bacterium]